ncbi:50S ribosomal protein L25 [bacterium]|nr:50S ribosomal protein L25 [bacterium]
MEQVTIQGELRTKVLKGDNKRLRRDGRVPAVIYGGEGEVKSISVGDHDMELVLRGARRTNTIFSLALGGAQEPALVREIQRHPVTEKLMHMDFVRVDLTKELEVEVPVRATGDIPPGVKAGGILEHVQRAVTIMCRALEIPDYLTANLSGLGMNQTFHVSDLQLPEGIRVIDEPETALFSVLPPRKEEEVVPAVAAEGAAVEPELIGKKKEEGEDAEEGKEKEKK